MTNDPGLVAVRRTYDTVAASYAELLDAEVPETPLDLAMIAAFAARVGATGGEHEPGGAVTPRVLDVGCGPGRLTAHLASLGLDAGGVDLSPGMVAEARRRHPSSRFEVGSMEDLAVEDAALAGVLAWYSVIHTPPERLDGVLAELHRVLAPGGHLLVGFHAGDERRVLTRAYGHDVTCVAYAHPTERVVAALQLAGLEVVARLERGPEGRELRPQASVLAQRPRTA